MLDIIGNLEYRVLTFFLSYRQWEGQSLQLTATFLLYSTFEMKRVLQKRHIHIAWGGGVGVVGLRLVRSRRFKPKNNIYFFNAEMLISVGKNITENMKGISYI